MQKLKARWMALLSATLLFLTFALTACVSKPEEGLGALRDIYIVTADLKTTYTVGDEFDYSSVKVRAVYENGDESLTAADKDKGVTHTELDMTKAGTQTLTVTYKQKSASVGINIIEEEKAVLKGLQFSGGKTAYTVGATIDYSQFRLTAIYSVGEDRTLKGDAQGVTHTDVNTSAEGTKELTFTYTDGGVSKSVSVDIIVSAAPVPVTLISIEVRSDSADRTVAFGTQLNATFLEKFTIVCHYSDGSTNTEPLKGTSNDVTTNVDTISTSVAGDKELTFTYQGKQATVTIIVLAQEGVITLNRFSLPTFYTTAAAVEDDADGTQSENRDSFMKGFETYKVGDDNAFEFQPEATTLISTTEAVGITVLTTFTLEMKGQEGTFAPVAPADVETYVKTNADHPNYYWFQKAAVGKVFNLKIKPTAGYVGQTNEIVAQNIEVVEGYNVYNQIGLSVFDNLNVKHWHDVKATAGTLRWDSKPLVDYNIIKTGDAKCAPVKNVVLHRDITIDPDQLPDSYFWQPTDEGYSTVNNILATNSKLPDAVKNNLKGSLKDGLNDQQWYTFDYEDEKHKADAYKEEFNASVNMQKAVYVSTGTGIQGNFHQLTYQTSGVRHNLYTVYDGKTATGSAFPLSHWSLFKYGNETTAGVEIVNGGQPTVSDLRILGQSPRLAATEGEPAHLMAFNSCTNTMTLKNSIVTRLFVVVLGDEASSGVNVSDCKIFDIYSNMFYLWRAKAEVKNSIMEDAGGPLFILCDGQRKATDNDAAGSITVDSASRLKSDASGNESWYTLNNAGGIFTALKGQVLQLVHAGTGRELVHKGTGDVELFNIIAIVVPEPSDLQTEGSDASNTYYPKGTIRRGTEGAYTDDYAVDWKFAAGGLFSLLSGVGPDTIYDSNAPIFISGTEKAAYINQNSFPYLYATEGNAAGNAQNVDFAERGTDWMFVTLRAAEKTPRFGILFGNVTAYSAS